MRYVCFHCHGTGSIRSTCTKCYNDDLSSPHDGDCDSGGQMPCMFCVGRGRPSEIRTQEPVVQLEFNRETPAEQPSASPAEVMSSAALTTSGSNKVKN